MPEPSTTLADIASVANVSVATVSRVLNGKPGISEDKRTQIELLLDERGYERRKKRRTTSIVDLIMRGLDTQWAVEILRGVHAEAARAKLDLVVTVTNGHSSVSSDWAERVVARGTDGVIVVVSELDAAAREELANLHAPVVMIDPVGGESESDVTVSATDWAGGRDAAEHLLRLGHERIGFVTGPMRLECHRDRLDGYFSALGRAGIAQNADLVKYGDSLAAGGEELGGELLDQENRPTAIISGSDEQAYGIYRAAQARGIRIPEDLSVIGFDDVDLCQWMTPPLTTVRQPLAEMGGTATRLLLSLAQGNAVAGRRVQLSSELIVRASTAAAPAAA
ncbi:MAG TPA: substrate-binding domain-containing protein [Microbacterium sp.]|nr:substrate-binding domain-containing protein [Microbacterium sp.]